MTTRLSRLALAVALVLSASLLAGCSEVSASVPRCRPDQRLALVAQSVRRAAYVPCAARLPAGWQAEDFDAETGLTRFELRSDRAARPVTVELRAGCRVGNATPIAPRADGVRSLLAVRSITPNYGGTLYDVFPGGCITYRFEFARGPHIALMDEFQQSVKLFSRRELRLQLRRASGVTLE